MVYLMVGNGNMGSILFHQTVQMALLQTPTVTGCQIYKNILTLCRVDGTIPTRVQFLTTVYGGTERFQSTTGTKKTRCSTTNPVVAILDQTVRGASSFVMKILLEIFVQMDLMTIKMASLTLQIQTTTAMKIA